MQIKIHLHNASTHFVTRIWRGKYCYVASAWRRTRRSGAHEEERGGAYRVTFRTFDAIQNSADAHNNLYRTSRILMPTCNFYLKIFFS